MVYWGKIVATYLCKYKRDLAFLAGMARTLSYEAPYDPELNTALDFVMEITADQIERYREGSARTRWILSLGQSGRNMTRTNTVSLFGHPAAPDMLVGARRR